MSLTGASGLHYAETAEDISRDLALDGAAYFRTDLIRQDVDMVTARINYRFQLGVVPPSSGGTDLISYLQRTSSLGIVRGLFVPALAERDGDGCRNTREKQFCALFRARTAAPALSAHAAGANRGRITVVFVPSPGSLSRPSRTRQNCYSATAFLMPCQIRSFKAISGGGGSISGGSVRLRPSTTRFATSISPSV
jgi:hypothetical protein